MVWLGFMQDTFESVLELADRMHLNCLTQKCEDMLVDDSFELSTGTSATDCHSVVRWAHLAQKFHLVVRAQPCAFAAQSLAQQQISVLDISCAVQALQMRCEHFMCSNFHKILDDPLLQARHNAGCML